MQGTRWFPRSEPGQGFEARRALGLQFNPLHPAPSTQNPSSTPLPTPYPLQVPEDAHTLDLVFQDAPGGGGQGFVDDNGGLDYHIPVEGGKGQAPALKVVHVAVEMAPIAKVGLWGQCVSVARWSYWGQVAGRGGQTLNPTPYGHLGKWLGALIRSCLLQESCVLHWQ